MRALDGLEGLVREGRASIARERSRQEEVYKQRWSYIRNSIFLQKWLAGSGLETHAET